MGTSSSSCPIYLCSFGHVPLGIHSFHSHWLERSSIYCRSCTSPPKNLFLEPELTSFVQGAWAVISIVWILTAGMTHRPKQPSLLDPDPRIYQLGNVPSSLDLPFR